MAKIVLDEVAAGYDLSKINDNFNKIEQEFQDKVFYRNNPDGEPNTLEKDIDANSKRIYNLAAPTSSNDAARLTDVQAAIAGLPTASAVPFTPAGDIAATTVQGAIQELDTEKAPLASPALTGNPTAPTPAVGDNDTSIATTAFVRAEFGNGFAGGGFGFKNKIINGNFRIWQRNTSQTSSGYGSADRWTSIHVGTTKTASRQSFAPGDTSISPVSPGFFMRHVVSSVAGAGNHSLLRQNIEDVNALSGRPVVITFWAKADAARPISVELGQNFGSGGSSFVSVSSTKITLSTSWTKYTFATAFSSVSGKTVGVGSHSQINFWFEAGSDFNSRTGTLGQQSGTFDIAQVQLEEGAVATPFEDRPLGAELVLCQRYYEQIALAVATVVPASAGNVSATSSYAAAKRGTVSISRITDNYAWGQVRCPGSTSYSSDLSVLRGFRATDGTQGQAQWSELLAVDAEL